MTSQAINAFLEDIGEVMKGVLMGSLVVAGGAIGWATAQARQPALVSDQAATRLAPAGFDQAQGGRR